MRQAFDIRSEQPLVTVITLTYNHAPYIRQCLDSILAQETDFPFEMIVHDDASTDGTSAIVAEYAEKYPYVIVPVLQKENQYSKGKGLGRFILPLIRGKYRASCEGDDYWHNPNKLSLQVEYLEAHPDVGLVHGDVNSFTQQTGLLSYNCRKGQSIVCTEDDPHLSWWILLGTYPVWTCTVCVRSDLELKVMDADPYVFGQNPFKMGDVQRWFEISRIAKVHYIPESLSTYRFLTESASHSNNALQRLSWTMSCVDLREYYVHKYECPTEMRRMIMAHWCHKLLASAYVAGDRQVARRAITKMLENGVRPSIQDRFLKFGVCAPGRWITRPMFF
ncbi:MAG: glycosyltransferase, partial [Kiritimatiellia bacterium]